MSTVDVAFPVRGDCIPADHAYPLFVALARLIPELRQPAPAPERDIAIHAIDGQPVGNRSLAITEDSKLTLRMDDSMLSNVIPLTGQRLPIGPAATVELGEPVEKPLRPVPHLTSRLVVIKGATNPESFLDSVRLQLDSAGLEILVAIPQRKAPHSVEGRKTGEAPSLLRRTLRIRDKQIVGYALDAFDLSPEQSLLLQRIGLGGRRHFGCGIFIPPPPQPTGGSLRRLPGRSFSMDSGNDFYPSRPLAS